MLQAPLSIVSPPGERGRLSILIFHRVLAERDVLFPETPVAAEFEQCMRWVKEWFNVLPLAEAIELLRDAAHLTTYTFGSQPRRYSRPWPPAGEAPRGPHARATPGSAARGFSAAGSE